MPPEIIGLFEKPHLLIAALLVGVVVGMTIERVLSEMQRKAWRDRNRWRWERKRRGGNIEQTMGAQAGRGHPETTRCCRSIADCYGG